MQNRAGKNRGSADRVSVQQAQLDGGNHGFDLGASAQPLVNRAHVRADGIDTETERQSDVFVAVPVSEQLQDLELPLGDELVRRRAALANGSHARRAAPRAIEHELRDGARHRHAAAQKLANGVRETEHVLGQQVAAGAGLDHRGHTLLIDRSGNHEQGSAVGPEQAPNFGDIIRPRALEGHDDGVGSHARQLFPASHQRRGDSDLDPRIGLQGLLGAAAIEPDEQDPGDGPLRGSRVPAAVHLVTRSYLTERVRPKLRTPQGFATCFELARHGIPDALAVYRLSSLVDVEFWAVTDSEREVVRLSEMFSASLVLGPAGAELGRVWTRGAERPFHSGDILLAEADEIQKVTPTDRPSASFTIFWQRSALDCFARESGLCVPLQWTLTQLSEAPLAAEFAQLRALLESGAEPELVLPAYRALTVSLLRGANDVSAPAVKRRASHPGVRRAARRVRESFAESLSLDDLANELEMSKCHLARCFERSLGVPPHRYRRLLRLQAARRLLEAGFSVGEAANETGFADAPHLTRAFREWLGVSPAAWGNAWRASDPWSEQAPKTIAPPKAD